MKSEIRVEAVSDQLQGNNLFFVIRCIVLQGRVEAGQDLTLPYNSRLDMTIPIDAIEILPQGDNHINIKVRCEDLSEIDFLHGLNLEKEVLTVECF